MLRFGWDPRLLTIVRDDLHAQWHVPPKKYWTLAQNEHNVKALQDLGVDWEESALPGMEEFSPEITATTAIPDTYLWLPSTSPRPHQLQASAWRRGLNPEGIIHQTAALEMGLGCVAGSTLISVSRGSDWEKMPISTLYSRWHGISNRGRHNHKPGLPTFVRSLKADGTLGLVPVLGVKDTGVLSVVEVILASGKSLVCTPDHEIVTPSGKVQAQDLDPGSEVLTNGVKDGGAGRFLPLIDTVVSVVPAGYEHVYDIGVDEDAHTYIANGIVVGNTGKTLVCVQEIERLLVKKPDAQILVLAPNATVDVVWEEQCHQHTGGTFDGRVWRSGRLDVILLSGPMTKRRERLKRERHNVWVHNHESLPDMGDALVGKHWDMIIIDEHSRFRNPTSARCKVILGTGRFKGRALTAPLRIANSGTPVIKRAQDVYATYRWLGENFGTLTQYRLAYCVMGGYGMHTEVAIRPGTDLHKRLDRHRFVVPKKAVLDLPRSFTTRRVDLPDWQRKIYNRVRDELVVQFEDELHPIVNPLTALMRLAQVTAGFEAISADEYKWYDDNVKASFLFDEALPEMFEGGAEKVIVWGWYRAEINELFRMATERGLRPVRYYGIKSAADRKERADAVSEFRFGEANLFIANSAAAGLGLNLPESAHMIYYTRSFDTEAYFQSLERSIRMDSKHKFYNVLTIEARDTVDLHITSSLRSDVKTAASLSSIDPKDVLGI